MGFFLKVIWGVSHLSFAVIKGASHILIHAPDMVLDFGTTCKLEKIKHNKVFLDMAKGFLRDYDAAVSYIPNQAYIGNINPTELRTYELPWYTKAIKHRRYGQFGEIMPQEEFLGLLKICDTFDLIKLSKEFIGKSKLLLNKHKLIGECLIERLKDGEELSEIKKIIEEQKGEGLYDQGELVGCVKRAHDIDINLSAYNLLENLVTKTSGVLAILHLLNNKEIDPLCVDYVIECSEEACGDINQRGGGNFAKAIAEISGLKNATGCDVRGFCAAPCHAIVQGASLVKSGVYENVIIVGGGTTAKLGLNCKDQISKGVHILEDVLGGFAVLISKNDTISPVIRTDLVGKHNVGAGSSPQAVINSLVNTPLEKGNMKIRDIDVYSAEMQNPDITKLAGAGNVPEANYKMIFSLGVKRREFESKELSTFIATHGLQGWAPTQGHIPSGIPYLGFGVNDLTVGNLNRAMIIGKGSLFLGRMTNLFDGISFLIERNSGYEEDSKTCALDNQKKYKIGITMFGSEHGINNFIKGAIRASSQQYDIVLIGPKINTDFELIEVYDEISAHVKMEQLLDVEYLDACVTMHYNFPIGIATVGKMITPNTGKEMILTSTTGTSSLNRVKAMVLNAINGVAVAKTMGIKKPYVGILNVDGARQTIKILKELKDNGYDINFGESIRYESDCIMRGNDVVAGTPDVMVTDTLTGNLLTKVFSCFSSGNKNEAVGYGYGPGVGEKYARNIFIISRESGASVIANSINYAYEMVRGDLKSKIKNEYENAKSVNLYSIINKTIRDNKSEVANYIDKPDKEVISVSITGFDIMELQDAVNLLWASGIYAESRMGCTGPIILVNERKFDEAIKTLYSNGYYPTKGELC